MMYLPSGVHSGDQYRVFLPFVSGRGVGAVGVRDPDVLVAAAVGQEDDLRAVGRVSRLAVEHHARGDPRRLRRRSIGSV